MSRDQPRWEADPSRVAIILPGGGYHPDMSLLYWTTRTLHDRGWTIRQVWWPDGRPQRPQWERWVRDLATEAVAAA